MQKKLIAPNYCNGHHNRIFNILFWTDFCSHSIIRRSPSADRADSALSGRCLRFRTR